MLLVEILLTITIGLLGIMIKNQIKISKENARITQELKDMKEFINYYTKDT